MTKLSAHAAIYASISAVRISEMLPSLKSGRDRLRKAREAAPIRSAEEAFKQMDDFKQRLRQDQKHLPPSVAQAQSSSVGDGKSMKLIISRPLK